MSDKIRENRIRRMLVRQGLLMRKGKFKDPLRIGYGGYQILDQQRNVVAGLKPFPYCLSLDDVEKYALEGHGRRMAMERAEREAGK